MMRTRWLVPAALVAVLVVPGLACAQQSDAKAQIATLEDGWIKAVVARDSAAFERLLHPDFQYTEDDRVYSRRQLIAETMGTTDTTTSGRNEDLVVRVHGDVAVATGWLVLIGRSGGKAFERRYRYTET